MERNGTFRYGKPMADVLSLKKGFYEENEKWAKEQEIIYEIYRKQKRRNGCKICSSKLSQNPYFINQGTEYYLCGVCGHLNGAYDDGYELTKELYESGIYDASDPQDRGESIAQFNERMDAIFVPKVRFMRDAFISCGISPEAMRYLEVGAGAGHMSFALNRSGLDVSGIEISDTQVEYANKMAGKELLKAVQVNEVANTIRTTDRDVVVFINVLEHITNLTEVFDCIKENKRIKYIYFCVPLMSLTCVFEVLFPHIYARHIGGGGGHTHLFSQQSLEWIFNKYSFKRIATWSFGADIMDLYRSIIVTLEEKKCHPDMVDEVSTFFREHTDALQLIVDKAGFASDVHIVAQVH